MTVYAVSACLVGMPCRYDGRSCSNSDVIRFLQGKPYVTFCPEEAGGLPTPRPPAEIQGTAVEVLQRMSTVRTQSGLDVSEAYVVGAARALHVVEAAGALKAILKAKSPACGIDQVYDGSFGGRLIAGEGVLAAKLRMAGIGLVSEVQLSTQAGQNEESR